MKKLLRDQQGMSLSTMIALGFVAAVGLVFVVGLVAFFIS